MRRTYFFLGVMVGAGLLAAGCGEAIGKVTLPPTDPAQTFSTSLHATREGKRTWYTREKRGL